MAGYVFVSNGTKNQEKYQSREPIKPGNVSRPCLQAALNMGYDVVYGVQRAKPEELECDMPESYTMPIHTGALLLLRTIRSPTTT